MRLPPSQDYDNLPDDNSTDLPHFDTILAPYHSLWPDDNLPLFTS